ncbi:MAG: exo-alpha-sialidase [Bdellovibrionales bacterium]|nr:exo-alpha-sialidase [Bdellovibrionales bacterium]
MEGAFLYNPEGSGQGAHGSCLLETHEGDLLVCWYAYPDRETADGRIVLARKFRGRPEWEKSRLLFPELQASAGNPLVVEHAPSGSLELYFVVLRGTYWTDSIMYYSVSLDRGYTWTRPAVAYDQPGLMLRHAPVSWGSDGWLLPAYDERTNRTVLLTGRGDSWEEHYCFDAPLIQPALVALNELEMVLLLRPVGDPYVIWRSATTTAGRRWSAPCQTTLPCPLSGIDAFSHPQGIAVVYNHSTAHQRTPLSLSTSEDGGVSWHGPYHLESLPFELSYPSFLLGSDGAAHGVFTYNRKMIKYVRVSLSELFTSSAAAGSPETEAA